MEEAKKKRKSQAKDELMVDSCTKTPSEAKALVVEKEEWSAVSFPHF